MSTHERSHTKFQSVSGIDSVLLNPDSWSFSVFVCVRSHGLASGAGQQEDQGVCDGGGGRGPDGGVCVLHQTQHLQGGHLREHPQGEHPL